MRVLLFLLLPTGLLAGSPWFFNPMLELNPRNSYSERYFPECERMLELLPDVIERHQLSALHGKGPAENLILPATEGRLVLAQIASSKGTLSALMFHQFYDGKTPSRAWLVMVRGGKSKVVADPEGATLKNLGFRPMKPPRVLTKAPSLFNAPRIDFNYDDYSQGRHPLLLAGSKRPEKWTLFAPDAQGRIAHPIPRMADLLTKTWELESVPRETLLKRIEEFKTADTITMPKRIEPNAPMVEIENFWKKDPAAMESFIEMSLAQLPVGTLTHLMPLCWMEQEGEIHASLLMVRTTEKGRVFYQIESGMKTDKAGVWHRWRLTDLSRTAGFVCRGDSPVSFDSAASAVRELTAWMPGPFRREFKAQLAAALTKN